MLRVLLGYLIALAMATVAEAQQRIGLVVGNQGYTAEVGPLKNPHNDTRIVAKALSDVGFQVLPPVRDATRDQLLLAVHEFAERLNATGPEAIGFLYYAGHGVAVGNDNVLVPVNVKGSTRRELEVYGVRLSEIVSILNDTAPQAVHFVVFDACRNLAGRRGIRGFVPVAERPGMLIAFSTAPGTSASDEGAGSGPYAAALASELVKPGRYHGDMFFEVRTKVARATREEQVPWTQDGLLRRVHFAKEAKAPTPGPDRLAEAQDAAAWSMAREAGSAAAFRKYMELHPKGRGVEDAKAHLDEIEARERLAVDQQKARFLLEAEQKAKMEAEEAAKRVAADRKNADALAWARATAANRLEWYRTYLKDWPSGDSAHDARQRIAELEPLAEAWRELASSRNLPRLENFTRDAKGSEFGPPGSARLTELRLLEDAAWRIARERDNLSAFELFVADWPEGFFAAEAGEKVVLLRAIRGQWEQLRASSDEKLLEAFVAKHGWSEFGAAVTAKLVALRRDRAQPYSGAKPLTAQELLAAIDGAEVRFVSTGETFALHTKGMPTYRTLLGRSFIKALMKQELIVSEGAFKANSGSDTIEGLGGIVESRVDKTGSLFLMQMHGSERSNRDVDQNDRQFLTMQVIHDSFGHVCIATQWQSLRAETPPAKRAERCRIERK